MIRRGWLTIIPTTSSDRKAASGGEAFSVGVAAMPVAAGGPFLISELSPGVSAGVGMRVGVSLVAGAVATFGTS